MISLSARLVRLDPLGHIGLKPFAVDIVFGGMMTPLCERLNNGRPLEGGFAD
jgi:hypothetical protein